MPRISAANSPPHWSAWPPAAKKDGGKHKLKTVQGEELTVSTEGNKVMVWDSKGNPATITIQNVFQSNGVIHVIDNVLLPA